MTSILLLTANLPEVSSDIKLDSNITLAIIVALTSLIAPIFVALINNLFQIKQRRKEQEHELKKREQELKAEMEKHRTEYDYKTQMHKYDSYYKNQTLIFEQLFNDVGYYLADMSNLDKYSLALSGIYKAQAYADGELASELSYLWGLTVSTIEGESKDDRKNAHDDALSQLSKVAKLINPVLKKNAKIDT